MVPKYRMSGGLLMANVWEPQEILDGLDALRCYSHETDVSKPMRLGDAAAGLIRAQAAEIRRLSSEVDGLERHADLMRDDALGDDL